ncbi:MAG TPA: DUF2339 domain-containing protein [Kiloniellaceae bacterium]|nr:DUF2339 domain-containing protein [Kiloniellaceae bacterium]
MYALLGIAAVLYLLVGPGLGIAAFFRGKGVAAEELATLRQRVEALAREIAALRGLGPQPAAEVVAPAPVPAPEPVATPEPQDVPQSAPAQPQPTAPAATPPRPRLGLEQWLASRGLVWLGGVILALAGLFLAKYGYEHGWLALGPGARCAAGFLFGVALAAGGEWLRRRPLQRAVAAIGPNYLPPALTAAGLASAFGSLYAAYALYGLLPPLAAFALLALVAFAAFALALLHGPFLAVLALLGGFVTPLLVESPEPSAWGLFAYLLALTAAALAVTRAVGAWWLAWGTLAGAVLWPLLWFAALWSPGDAPPLGSYLVVLAVLFVAVRHRTEAPAGRFFPTAAPDVIAWAGGAATALLGFILLREDFYGPAALIAAFALTGVYLAAAWREAALEGLAILGALFAVAVVAAWHIPAIGQWPELAHEYAGQSYGSAVGPLVPPSLEAFVLVAALFGALFAAAGFAALFAGAGFAAPFAGAGFAARGRAGRPALWAGISAAVPVVLLAVAYWRVTDLGVDLGWSAAAVALAALGLGAAAFIRRTPPHGEAKTNDLLLAIYALGAVAALGLAFAMALEQAWLTVALSLLLPATAWIATRLDLASLRPVALVVAAVVLARLVLNWNVLDYPLGSVPGASWVLYGYGVPALAFWWAARRLRAQRDDHLVTLLEGGTLVLVWLLVTFEIRSLVAGDLAARAYALPEQSLQTVAWLAIAYACLRLYRRSGRVALLWGWRLLAGLAAVHSPLVQLLAYNPLFTGEPVGAWPILNLLALAYLVPAGFALAFARELRAEGHRKSAMAAAVYALLLVFTWITLEVRRAFQGPVLDAGFAGDGELLAYTLAWLAYAWLLLGLGIRTGYASLRYASLAVLAVAAAKVLLFDWGSLEGLERFFAFAALGFSLLGIPFLYQRLVFPPRQPAGGPAPQPGA